MILKENTQSRYYWCMTDCEMYTLLRFYLKRKQNEYSLSSFILKIIRNYTKFCITSKLIGAMGLAAALLVFNTHFLGVGNYYYQLQWLTIKIQQFLRDISLLKILCDIVKLQLPV